MAGAKVTCSRLLLVTRGILYVKGEWLPGSCRMVATDGRTAWCCHVAENEVKCRAEDWGFSDPREYMLEVFCRHLEQHCDDVDYQFEAADVDTMKLSWLVSVGSLKLRASLIFRETEDSGKVTRGFLDHLIEENIRLDETVQRKSNYFERMKKENEVCILENRKLKEEREAHQSDFYKMFVEVLCSKKRKLKELKNSTSRSQIPRLEPGGNSSSEEESDKKSDEESDDESDEKSPKTREKDKIESTVEKSGKESEVFGEDIKTMRGLEGEGEEEGGGGGEGEKSEESRGIVSRTSNNDDKSKRRNTEKERQISLTVSDHGSLLSEEGNNQDLGLSMHSEKGSEKNSVKTIDKNMEKNMEKTMEKKNTEKNMEKIMEKNIEKNMDKNMDKSKDKNMDKNTSIQTKNDLVSTLLDTTSYTAAPKRRRF